MSDLYNWLSPVKELVAGEGVAKVIVSLVNVVKEKIPSISCNKPGKAGFPITMAIKLLLAYITPPREAKGGSGSLSCLFFSPSYNDVNQNILTFKFLFRLTTGIFILPAYDEFP